MKTTNLFHVLLAVLAITFSEQSHAQWSLSGNSLSSPAILGTLNTYPIEFRTDNLPWLWLETNGGLSFNSGLGNLSPRPSVSAGTNMGEFRAQSVWGTAADDGFVRFSAGGGTGAYTKSFIDISGYSAVPDMDRNIVFGTNATERMRIDQNGYVGIGTSFPGSLLHVDGTYILQTNAYGSTRMGASPLANETGLMIRPSSGKAGSLQFTEDIIADRWAIGIKPGVDAFIFAAGASVTSGTERARLTNSGNLGIGTANPLYRLDVNGDINLSANQGIRMAGTMMFREKNYGTYIGRLAGFNISSGVGNVCLGDAAGYNITTGDGNLCLGMGAGFALSPGIAMAGIYNTIVGTFANSYGTGADYNTALGYSAAAVDVDYGTAIGAHAEVTTSNTLALGGATPMGLTTVVIGNDAATSPTTYPVSGGSAFFGPYILEVNGDACFSGVYVSSDRRFKKGIEDFTNAKDLLRKLRPVTYQYRDDLYFPKAESSKSKPVKMNFSKAKQIGFIAQELEEIIPEMVITRGDGYKNVNYNHLFGVLVQGFKEQDIEITTLKEDNDKLTSIVEELKNRLDALEKGTTKPVITISGSDATTTVQPRLEQNNPNPFTENTTFKYFIPQQAGTARLIIRSVNTTAEVMSVDLNEKGNGSMIISGNTLSAGAYTCELYIDGKLSDTKKMILVK